MEKEDMVSLVKNLGRDETIMLLETIVEQLEEEELLESTINGLNEDVYFALLHNL